MGFDPNKNIFTSEPYRLLEAQTHRPIYELHPGEIVYVPLDCVYRDVTSEDKVLVDKLCPTYDADGVYDAVVSAWEEEYDPPEFARLIRIDEGIILDLSDMCIRDWNSNNARELYDPRQAAAILEDPERFDPVIFAAHNDDELSVIKPAIEAALKYYGSTLEGTELRPIVIEATEYIQNALQEEEDASEEDEDLGGSDSPLEPN